MKHYELIDTGNGQKLEQWGTSLIARPAGQAVWSKTLSKERWKKAVASLTRHPKIIWKGRQKLKERWQVEIGGIKFWVTPTDFGHLGAFPEQLVHWDWIQKLKGSPSILNLFAHTGGTTLAAAKAGCSVCHVDAAAGINDWARENAELNGLKSVPVRWITDDVRKFLKREIKRGRSYDGIVLDPPTFGRGKRGELFKIEEDLPEILQDCKTLLSKKPQFILLTCHTPGWTAKVLENMLLEYFGGSVESGEMLIEAKEGFPLPSGSFARWLA